jgi:mono/diheme cytochrome c family protein
LELPPAKYPFPTEAALVTAGGQIFAAECARCHAFGGERTGKVIPLGEIGTDRHFLDMWTSAATTLPRYPINNVAEYLAVSSTYG